MIHFILGGARSGKSRFAEQQVLDIAKRDNKQPVYIATASAIDSEMEHRISKHQIDRCGNGDCWQLIECPLALADSLTELDSNINNSKNTNTNTNTDTYINRVYLVDCLTLWLNNQLFSKHEAAVAEQSQHLQSEVDLLLSCLEGLGNEFDIVIVSNEIGLGVIPMGESTRLYVDYCGWLNQGVARVAEKVTLVTAGIPLTIKDVDKKS
jgi:adenosylcobinamide kinase/adenosylcobinamide-phosphate guanylyltransferase